MPPLNVTFVAASSKCNCSAEDVPSFAVSEGDALRRHFEVDHCCHWTRTQSQSTFGCFGNCLRPRQRFGFHRVQVKDVAGLEMGEMKTCCIHQHKCY